MCNVTGISDKTRVCQYSPSAPNAYEFRGPYSRYIKPSLQLEY